MLGWPWGSTRNGRERTEPKKPDKPCTEKDFLETIALKLFVAGWRGRSFDFDFYCIIKKIQVLPNRVIIQNKKLMDGGVF